MYTRGSNTLFIPSSKNESGLPNLCFKFSIISSSTQAFGRTPQHMNSLQVVWNFFLSSTGEDRMEEQAVSLHF
jgi:hypothetical protein